MTPSRFGTPSQNFFKSAPLPELRVHRWYIYYSLHKTCMQIVVWQLNTVSAPPRRRKLYTYYAGRKWTTCCNIDDWNKIVINDPLLPTLYDSCMHGYQIYCLALFNTSSFCQGTLNSTEDVIACIQPWRAELTKITEDCLILNVWTPFPRPQNASVMVRHVTRSCHLHRN
jgi:hypothetical protein